MAARSLEKKIDRRWNRKNSERPKGCGWIFRSPSGESKYPAAGISQKKTFSSDRAARFLAGDIDTKRDALPWIREFRGETPTADVCGNHEFYGDRFPRLREKRQNMTAGSGIHVLEDSFFAVGEWHVSGCTLWTDMALMGNWPGGAALAAERMNDYKRVRNSGRHCRKLRPVDTLAVHQQSVRRMTEFFQDHDSTRTIVVTHHAPSLPSLPMRRRSDQISCAYASHLEDFILKHKPALWIHGHIHHSNDYRIGATRVMTNPQAYPDDPNSFFDPRLVLEFPEKASVPRPGS